MTKHVPTPAPRFNPNTWDDLAIASLVECVRDASGRPFLGRDTAIRYALGVAVRVVAAGRIAEFTNPLNLPGAAATTLTP